MVITLANFLNQITDKTVGIIVMVALVPVALLAYFQTNTSEFDTATLGIWGIIGILFIVAVVKLVL